MALALRYRFQEAKAAFFRDDLLAKIGKAKFRALSKFGAYVRTRSRTSLRYKQGTAPAGKPPYSHSGLLRDFIYFAYDESTGSVVIGPVVLNGGSAQALESLEYGGPSILRRFRHGKYEEIATQTGEHPFMRPAYQEELDRGSLEKVFDNAMEKVN